MSQFARETFATALEVFIRENFQVDESDPYFTHGVHLWEEGYVDSTGLVEIIAFLEERFHVTISDEMLFSPDFTSISGISRLVAGLKAA